MAVFIENPILFGFYFIEVFINLELFGFFLLRWMQEKKERHISVLGASYFCLGMTRVFLIPWDFFSAGDIYYNIGALFAFIAMAVFMYASETLLKFWSHPFFPFVYIGLAVLCIFLPYEIVRILYYIFSPIMIVLLIGFLCILMSRTYGKVRRKFFLIFLGICIYGIGYALGAQFLRDLFTGLGADIYGIFVSSTVLTGLGFTGLGFMGVPSLSEIHWEEFTIHVYVFHIDTAVCMYDESLLKKDIDLDNVINEDDENLKDGAGVPADLFSSGVVGVMGLIKEMVSSDKRLKVLDHEDKKILLEYGKFVSIALLTFKDLKIYHEKMESYIDDIEAKYEKHLEKWDGEITKFKEGLTTLTQENFKDIMDPTWWKVDFSKLGSSIKQFFKRGKNTNA